MYVVPHHCYFSFCAYQDSEDKQNFSLFLSLWRIHISITYITINSSFHMTCLRCVVVTQPLALMHKTIQFSWGNFHPSLGKWVEKSTKRKIKENYTRHANTQLISFGFDIFFVFFHLNFPFPSRRPPYRPLHAIPQFQHVHVQSPTNLPTYSRDLICIIKSLWTA